jgi:preprotein translocase subunit SecG
MSAETRATVILLIILLLIGMGLFFGIRYESNSSRADAAEVRADAAEKAADQATAVMSNVLTTMSVFNAISRANADAKQQIDTDTEAGVAAIEKAISDDDCAKRYVPSAAVEQLRADANRIRAGSSGSNSGRSAH